MQFNYYYGNQTEQFQFIMIPRALVSGKEFEELSFAAKLIYGLLRDKISLSRKNGWMDDENRVYIIYTNKQLMEEMSLSEKLVIKYTNELEEFGLIEKKRQGLGLPNLIYVKNFICEENEPKKPEESPENHRPSQMGSSGTSDMVSSVLPEWEAQDLPEWADNNTNYNNTDKKETNDDYPHILSSEEPVQENSSDKIDKSIMNLFYENHVKMQIDYDSLVEDGKDKGILDNIVSLMSDIFSLTEGTVTVGKQPRSVDQVKRMFLSVKKKHIEYVLERLMSTGSEIKNIRQYLLTMLYNAPQTFDVFIAAEVAKGMVG